jgi:hypothetical protein
MRASILLATAAIAGTAALSSSASAQVGVYVGPGYGDYYYCDTPAYPRAYGYNYYYDNDRAYAAPRAHMAGAGAESTTSGMVSGASTRAGGRLISEPREPARACDGSATGHMSSMPEVWAVGAGALT